MPVNWRDMETEELGSVYESLLELVPRLTADGRGFAFAGGIQQKGNARRTTGSYYTPDSLVQALLDSALDPVLNRVESEAADPVAGLLGVTVIDPACGSGHFLLAAVRRIATRVARLRSGGVPTPTDYRRAEQPAAARERLRGAGSPWPRPRRPTTRACPTMWCCWTSIRPCALWTRLQAQPPRTTSWRVFSASFASASESLSGRGLGVQRMCSWLGR